MSGSQKEPRLVGDNNMQNVNDKLKYTETDMMVGMFANPETLKENVIEFNKDNYRDNDNADTYVPIQQNHYGNNEDAENNDVEEHYQSKPSKKDTHHSKTDSETATEKVDPDDESKWSEETMTLKKLDMLRKLGELAQSGVKLSQNYSIKSDYKTMKFEYELHTGIKSKQAAISWMSGMMIGIVKGIELLNDNLNPFDIKFDNIWSNKVTTDVTDYYDVLGQIYEKYTTPGKKMAPELKLFLMLTGSAISIQMHRGIASYVNGNKASKELNDEQTIEKMRAQAEKDMRDEDQRKKKIEEKFKQEHEQVTNQVADLEFVKHSGEQFTKLQKDAGSNVISKMKQNLLLSDSAKSVGKYHAQSETDNHSASARSEFFRQQEKEFKKKRDLDTQNRELQKINDMMRNFNKENEIVEKNSKNVPQKIVELKGMTPVEPKNSNKSHLENHSAQKSEKKKTTSESEKKKHASESEKKKASKKTNPKSESSSSLLSEITRETAS